MKLTEMRYSATEIYLNIITKSLKRRFTQKGSLSLLAMTPLLHNESLVVYCVAFGVCHVDFTTL